MRRVTCSQVLRGSLCACAFILTAALLSLWVPAELTPSPEEHCAHLRGCVLCHGNNFSEHLLPSLRRIPTGTAIRPLLKRELQQAHPLLSKGAENELSKWLAGQQLTLLTKSRSRDAGAQLYRAKCAVCHGSNGQGTPGTYPPLQGSEWLTATPSRLPEILTQGLSGPIEVRGQQWNSVMLPPGLKNEKEVQHIIHYIISTFAH